MYNEAIDFILYLPIAIFGITSNLSMGDNDSEIIKWIFLILSLFEPYIFILFGKRSKNTG